MLHRNSQTTEEPLLHTTLTNTRPREKRQTTRSAPRLQLPDQTMKAGIASSVSLLNILFWPHGLDINKKAYTRLWGHFGPRGKDLCERGEWTHLEDFTKLHLLVKTTDYRPDPVREPLAPTRDFKEKYGLDQIWGEVSISPHVSSVGGTHGPRETY